MTFTRITVFLLQGVQHPEDAIDADKQTTSAGIAPSSGVTGKVFYQKSSAHPPGWVTEVNAILQTPVAGVVSASSSGVVILQASDRWFAVSFGYGRSLIDPSAIERQFGLRVALNLIDPAQLRSMDTKTFEDLVVSKSTQSSKSSDLPAFGVDISKDILRGVAGAPRDKRFASRLHGADAITLVARVSAADLPHVCAKLLSDYGRDDYKANFEWIDQLSLVDDPTTKEALNSLLIDDLRARNTTTTYMAAPEVIEWADVDYFFTMTGTRRTRYEDLDLDAYLGAQEDNSVVALTIKSLQQRGVSVNYARSGNSDRLWSVYLCLISEQRLNGHLFVLLEGRWFSVDETLADQVDTYFRGVVSTAALENADPDETEPDFNERMARDHPDVYLHLDAKILRPGGASTGIEFCDLLAKDGTLIHVKRKSRSSTLSHLFAQGSVSARALISDGVFRDAIRSAIPEELDGRDPAPWLALVPDGASEVSPLAFKVSYVVLTKPVGGKSDWMPFFSKLNLMQHGRELQRMSFGVSVSRLDN